MRIPDATGMASEEHSALLTLASHSSYTLPVHGLSAEARPNFFTTSLDHAMWIHKRPDCSAWMLVQTRWLLVGDERGMMHALFRARHGRPIATVVQQT